jgi:hypothetical protein
VELVITKVERGVDRFERFKIKVDFLLLSLVGENGAAVDDETVRRSSVVELETLLGGRDGSQDGQSVYLHKYAPQTLIGRNYRSGGELYTYSGFDVRRSAVFLRKHVLHLGDLCLGSCNWSGLDWRGNPKRARNGKKQLTDDKADHGRSSACTNYQPSDK